jgi:hypothetical protein
MSKLYIFGIGGTGSRVLKSLIFLLASGIKTEYEIVPVIIDPDRSGGDKSRTEKLLSDYQYLHNQAGSHEESYFFSNKLSALSQILSKKGKNSNVIDGFNLHLEGTSNELFKNFIDYETLDDNNQALADLLFTEKNLKATMEVGFKGNPNIGSVVLNQFSGSEAFIDFADTFEDGDRIFIISSIFGGTGAAGFPLLLKNLRNGQINNKPYKLLQEAPIAALSVLPYFKVKADESEIDSHTFISKTKSALRYYHENINANDSLDILYYLGDNISGIYENHEGGRKQKNNAHFVEIAGALSIIDFANTHKSTLENNRNNGRGLCKEFGIENDTPLVTFEDLGDVSKGLVKKPLTAYFYTDVFLKNKLRSSLNNPFAQNSTVKIDENFLNQPFYKRLTEFNITFRTWLAELAENRVGFKPFAIVPEKDSTGTITGFTIETTEIFSLVSKTTPRKKGFGSFFKSKNYELFVNHLNKVAKDLPAYPNAETGFMQLFSKASMSIIKEKLF